MEEPVPCFSRLDIEPVFRRESQMKGRHLEGRENFLGMTAFRQHQVNILQEMQMTPRKAFLVREDPVHMIGCQSSWLEPFKMQYQPLQLGAAEQA